MDHEARAQETKIASEADLGRRNASFDRGGVPLPVHCCAGIEPWACVLGRIQLLQGYHRQFL